MINNMRVGTDNPALKSQTHNAQSVSWGGSSRNAVSVQAPIAFVKGPSHKAFWAFSLAPAALVASAMSQCSGLLPRNGNALTGKSAQVAFHRDHHEQAERVTQRLGHDTVAWKKKMALCER